MAIRELKDTEKALLAELATNAESSVNTVQSASPVLSDAIPNRHISAMEPAQPMLEPNDKKSFILYSDYLQHVQLLTREERGDLFTAILEYVNDIEISQLSSGAKMAFSFVKANLDRDYTKWEDAKAKMSEGGKKGMEARWGKKDSRD